MSGRLLLDTHVVVWALLNDPRLSSAARKTIEQAGAQVWVSAASIWEISIKFPLKRVRDPIPFSAQKGLELILNSGFQLLAIRPEHAAAVESLPPLHADPFDRLLLAQARTEPMHLLTHDAALIAYGTGVIAV